MTQPQKLHPVSEYDNLLHKGMALSSDGIYQDGLKKIEALRQQEAEYIASLPTDPERAINEAKKLLRSTTDIDEMLDQTKAMLTGIEAIAKDLLLDEYENASSLELMASLCWRHVNDSINTIKRANHILNAAKFEESQEHRIGG